tara:strand:- start:320 stop:649 length:330 start_codon:yes stop_codon:yes gene_type:complete
MASGCERAIKIGQNSHIKFFEDLKDGICRVVLGGNRNVVYCTLSENAIPAEGSARHKQTKFLDLKDKYLMVWALNKNFNNKLDPTPGWYRMQVNNILEYEFIGNIEYGE